VDGCECRENVYGLFLVTGDVMNAEGFWKVGRGYPSIGGKMRERRLRL
jgi:hypothetical protein